MSEFKNFDTEEKKLKKADARKMSSADSLGTVSELLGGKKTRDNAIMTPMTSSKKRRFPIVVDIIVGVVMLALVAALLIGAYILFTYYSNDYNGVDIEYTVVCTGVNESSLADVNNGELYCDVDGNTLFLGKIQSVTQEEKDGVKQFILEIKLDDVRYRDGEGYFVSSERLAVGASFALRCNEKDFVGTVVEISRANREAK